MSTTTRKKAPRKRGADGKFAAGKLEITPEQLAYIEANAGLLTQNQIADALGIAARTLRSLMAREDAVRAAYDKGAANTLSMVAGKLVSEALSGNTAAICFYLKTKGRWLEVSDEEKAVKIATAERIRLETELLKKKLAAIERAEGDGDNAGVFLALISDKPLTDDEIKKIAEDRAREGQ